MRISSQVSASNLSKICLHIIDKHPVDKMPTRYNWCFIRFSKAELSESHHLIAAAAGKGSTGQNWEVCVEGIYAK